MFKQKRTLLFLNHEETPSFMGKRFVFDTKPEKPQEAVKDSTEKPSAREVLNVLEDLKTKDESVEFKPNGEDTLNDLAKKLYPTPGKEQQSAKQLLGETFEGINGKNTKAAWDSLKQQGGRYIRVDHGVMKFYKDKGLTQELNEAAVPVRAPSALDGSGDKPVDAPKGAPAAPVNPAPAPAPGPAPQPKPEAPKEKTGPTPEQKAALDYFKKAFPNAQPDQIRLNTTEKVPTGSASHYIDRSNTTDPDYYNEEGQGRTLYADQLRTGNMVPVDVQQGFIIEAPKKNGAMGKFVFTELTLDPYVGAPTKTKGWVEVGSLRKGRETLKTENAWNKPPEFSADKVIPGEYESRGNSNLSNNEGKTISLIKKGDKLTITDAKIRHVGDEDFVAVKTAANDQGWVRKDVVSQAIDTSTMVQDVYKKEKDQRSDETLVTKYYNRDSGKIHFDGDKKAEQQTTISDLFPGAKDGDKIRIKRKGAEKTMEATYKSDKEYIKYIDGKAQKHKGTFVYGNGQRVEIYDGDIILPAWEKTEKAEGPKDRAFLETVTLNEGDTYNKVAERALTLPEIKKAFENSTFSPVDKINAYIALLKQYQKGNNLFLVIPNATEAGVPTINEGLDAKAQKYSNKFEQQRSALNRGLREDLLKAPERKVILRASIADIVGDKDKWNKAWNGEGNQEMAGLDKLINVLKDPIFAQAGINESTAREKMRGLITEYSDSEVDLEDVINYLKIYNKPDGSTGSFGDFKSELNANKEAFKNFEAIRTQLVKDTEIISTVQQKMLLAQANGETNPYDLSVLVQKKYITVDQLKDYIKAQETLQASYPGMERMLHLNAVMDGSARLLDALGQLDVKTFKVAPGEAAPEKLDDESKRSLDALSLVFHDVQKENWRTQNQGTNEFAWEDVVAGTEEKDQNTTAVGRYYSEGAPMLRVRSKINKFTDASGNLDGVERLSEKDTVNELNRLMKKSLKRLIAWKNNPGAAVDFLNKYGGGITNKPEKNADETDEAYALRLAPLLVTATDAAFNKLKINNLAELTPHDADQNAVYEDRRDLIRMGYYFDSRDEEKGVKEGTEGGPEGLSMNPMIRAIQVKAIAEGYPPKNAKKIENLFIGGLALKVDTTKPAKQALGAGLGTGIDLGDGFTLLIGVGVDSLGSNPNPVLGVAIRKEFNLSEDKRTKIGLTAGPTIGFNGPGIGPSLGVGADLTFPISGNIDMTLFATASLGVLLNAVGGGIGISKNLDATQQNLEKEIGGFDPKEIDKEQDPGKRYMLIINNPTIGAFYRAAAIEFPADQQQQVVLDLYNQQRASVANEAVKQTDAPFLMGGGVFAGAVEVAPGVFVPYVGPYLVFNFGKSTSVYRRQSAASQEMEGVSDAKINDAMLADVQKKYPGNKVEMKTIKAGESGDVMVDKNGEIAIRRNKSEVNLAGLKDKPNVDKYNEALKPYDMKLVPDANGLLEFQVFGALGNLKMLIDPGMENKGLILKDGKVFLAPGAKPDLFITREEFFTPFPKKGSNMNTIITISDTPKRTRNKISDEVDQTGAYLYRKSGAQWEIISSGTGVETNVADEATYNKNPEKFETFKESVPGFDETQWKAYEAKVNGLPFVKEPEADLDKENTKQLKDFSKKFLLRNVAKYRELTTVTPTDSEQTVNEKRRKLAELIQKDAKTDVAPKGFGVGHELSDLQMNFVMSELMDLSFSELDKAGDKRARFEQNLEWSKKAVLLPFFRLKIETLKKRGVEIKHSAEELVDLLVKRLLTNVKDDELGKPGQPLGPNWLFSSVAGAIGTGLRGVPGYISQDKYGVLGLNEEDLSKPGTEGELAKVILELESPLDTTNDKAVAESPLAKKLISMPGMWFVLGDAMANQAVDGMAKAAKGETVGDNAGFAEFKKILQSVRDTQLKGGNTFIYDAANGNSFEFRLDTHVADAAHARCGNASFGVKEGLQIFARVPNSGMIVAAANESNSTVTPETVAHFITFGIAGVVTIDTRPKPPDIIPPPPETHTPATPVAKPAPAPGVSGNAGNGDGGTVKAPGTQTGGGGE